MGVGVTSSGRYVISSHHDGDLIQWHIANRENKKVQGDVNIYSAERVPGRDAYLWQDLSDEVHVRTFTGEKITEFEAPTPAYSHAISSDLESYLLSDKGWRLHHRTSDKQFRKIKEGEPGTLVGLGKPLNIDLDETGRVASIAGFGAYYHQEGLTIEAEASDGYQRFDGVAVWDLDAGEPTHNLKGNAAKTHASLSPNGNHVIAVDENGKAFWWRLSSGERQILSSVGRGVYVFAPEGSNDLGHFDDSGLHLDPDRDIPEGFEKTARIGVHFVSSKHFITLYHNNPYAAVYKLGDPYARAIVNLGTDPFPSVDRYSRNEAIDSAPEANLLVTGQRSGGGINVYRFDPEELTLEKVWAPTPSSLW